MINLFRFLSKKRPESLETEADRRRAKTALEASGMAESDFEAMLADERLSHRVEAKVMSGMRQREEPQGIGFPSLARVAATFSLLTVLLVGLAWAAPLFRAGYPTDGPTPGPVEPASIGATCQLGGERCRVSADEAVRTLVQRESVE